jgi:hypothetical protein
VDSGDGDGGPDPVLSLYVFGERLLDGLQLVSSEAAGAKPHQIETLRFRNEPDPIQLSAVAPGLAAQMAPFRARLIQEIMDDQAQRLRELGKLR